MRKSLEPLLDDATFYREVFRVSNDGIAIIDPQGRYLAQNDAHRRMLGYEDYELRDQTPAIHVGEEEFGKIAAELKARGSYRGEVMSRTKAGEVISLELVASAITNDSGETVAYVGIKRDISLRKRYEAEIQRRYDELRLIYNLTQTVIQASDIEEVYKAALAAIQQGLRADRASILLFDADGVMRFKAWTNLSDEYRSIVEGHSPWRGDESAPQPIVISDVAGDRSVETLRATLAREGIAALGFFPLLFQRKLLGKFMVYFGTPHQFSVEEIELAQNIANHIAFSLIRKQTEQLQHQTSHILQAVIEASPLAIVAIDGNGGVMIWNRAAERLLGWTCDEVIGHPPPHLPEEKRDELFAYLHKAMNENTTTAIETKRVRRDGRLLDVALHWAPLRNLHGTRLGILGIIADISDRKQSDRERERLLAQLRSEHDQLMATQHELNERVNELEKFEEVVVGRELKMIELEKEVQRLRQALSRETDRSESR